MALNITRGVVPKAQKVVIYGPEGIGKTTFAAQFPNPLFIDTEGSTVGFDLARTEAPQSWTALLQQVRDVKAERPCQTLVIDTADWAERLDMRHVCAQNGWKGIEDPGFGKGYTPTVEEFGKLLDLLTDVIEAGINVVLTAHAAIRKFEQPDEAASYNRWALALIDAPKMSNAAKVKEWADAVLFVNFKTYVEVVGEGKSAKGKAVGGQKRVMYTQHHACWDAKNRWGLPAEVPFDYAQIAPFIPAFNAPAATPIATPAPAAPIHAQSQAGQGMPEYTEQDVMDGIVNPEVFKAQEMSLPDCWIPALQLMEPDGITPDEVVAMAARKGWFTVDTPPANLPEEFINGCLIGQWQACRNDILDTRPVPFEK